MKKVCRYTSIHLILIILGLAIASCTSDEPVPVPAIRVGVAPEAGNTTQTFTFELEKSESRSGRGNKLFTRWDWDGDGNWDTPFTRMLVYTHRYYAPGTWKPRLEMANLDGGTDTVSLTIPVERGYSAPRPDIALKQDEGHIFTSFLLDASGTRDDEDSLNLLKFRWDFEGDGHWDTPYGDSMQIHHRYPETGIYLPLLQVRDPAGLVAYGGTRLTVTLRDPGLIPLFRCIPDSVINDTVIRMDASQSFDTENPGGRLFYRWDWESDQVWDTGWLNDPVTEHIFPKEFMNSVTLQVMSARGLMNDTIIQIRVFHKNRNPKAAFMSSTFTGNLNTTFRFDCWPTRDYESSPSELFYRWDFDGDGNWDTGLTNTVAQLHQFTERGIFKTVVEIKDIHGGSDTCSETITVTRGTNQTGLVDVYIGFYQTYGTVLIGDQWWFSRNLATQDTSKFYLFPFTNDWPAYFTYGHLYTGQQAGCPDGWRLPTREDWDKLFANYPEEQVYDALMPGGESDFGANLCGAGLGTMVPDAIFSGIGKTGYYWSSSKPIDPAAISNWIITFEQQDKRILKGFGSVGESRYGVRCVKDR